MLATVLLVWTLVGALVGSLGAVLVQVGPSWAAALVHYATPYSLLIVLVGAVAPRARSAALRSACCFTAFVVAYYGVVALQFHAIPVLYASAWLIAALTVCPVGAALVNRARERAGLAPAAVFALAGAAAVSDGSLGNLVRVALGRLDPTRLSAEAATLGCTGLVTALVITALVPRHPRTRLLAVLLLVPFGFLATLIGWTVHFGVGPYL